MWYLILTLLLGQGGDSTQNSGKSGQQTMQKSGDHGGETSTPRPPKNP